MSQNKGFKRFISKFVRRVNKDGDNVSGKIPEHLIEQIRSQSDIVDVISDYMQLTKKGRNWFGLCPFHGESTPSFSVSQDKQIFHCFGCGAGGNAITFVMDIENIAFPDAVVKLAERTGTPIDSAYTASGENKQRAISPEHQAMLDAHEFATDFYHHLLMNTEDGEQALEYLLSRGFTKELIESQKLGFALSNWEALSTMLSRKGFELDTMVESGLILKKEHEDGYFDRFRNRIMFPIRDESGKVIAFSGRIIEKTDDEAKYLNSPESPIFHKSQVLYNLDKARASIRKTRKVILMEGFVDVLAANRAGVFNAVATMGTSLTAQHIQKLKRLVEHITICYDGDNAGFEAAKRAAILLKNERLTIDVATLPDKLDPDDYIRTYGNEAFVEQILSNPQSYMAFMKMSARKGKNLQYESDTIQYIHEVLQQLVGITSPIERDLYITQLSNETNVAKDAIETTYRKLEQDVKQDAKKQAPQPVQLESRIVAPTKVLTATDRAEKLLLTHMLRNEDVIDKVSARTEHQNPFVHEEYKAVYVKLVAFYEMYLQADFQRFVELLDDAELRKIVMEAALMELDEDHQDAEINDCLKQLEKHRILHEIDQLVQESKEAEKMFDYIKARDLVVKQIELKRKLSTM